MFLTPPYLAALVFLPLGACVGSFLNVVAYRLPLGMSLCHPGSHCPRCGLPIAWYDNIPVFAWLFLRGRGRCCGQPVSIRYPLVEMLTALLWAGIAYATANPAETHRADNPFFLSLMGLNLQSAGCVLAWQLFASVLVAISLIDLDYKNIPDRLTFPATITGILLSAVLPGLHPEFSALFPAVPSQLSSVLGALAGALAGGGCLLLLTLAGTSLMRKQLEQVQKSNPDIRSAIGYGDVKLLLVVGAFLGWQNALLTIAFGAIYGTLIGIPMRMSSGSPAVLPDHDAPGWLAGLVRRWRTGGKLMPLGPFLSLGALTALFFGQELFTLWLSLVFPE